MIDKSKLEDQFIIRTCYWFVAANKPIILLLFTAGPVNVTDAKGNANVGAILLCFYPGQGTGEALRRIMAVADDGSVVSPAARMPYTWPASLEQVTSSIK